MKIAITGARGYLGENIIKELEKKDVDIIRVNRHLLYGLPQDLAKLISGCHAVINLAGAPIIQRWTKKNKVIIYNSRVLTTKNLCTAINSLSGNKQPSIYISASATGIYRENATHDESSSKFANNFAARVVDDWEDASEGLDDKIRKVIFRTGVVLGKKSQTISKLKPLFKLGLGAKIGNGKQPFPYIHINDLVNAYSQAIFNKQYVGIYNLVAPEMINNATFTKTFAHAVSRPAFLRVPTFFLILILGKSSQLLCKGSDVIPSRLAKLNFEYEYPTIDQAMDEITKNKNKKTPPLW